MKIRKRRIDGVTQGYHVLGRGHSAEALDIGRGKVVKKFLGTVHKDPNLDRDIEFLNYIKLKLFLSQVIIPMKWTRNGLEMPKLNIITRSALPHEYRSHGIIFKEGSISDTQLQTLKDGLRELSNRGIATDDILHAGISAAGRPYFFDVGGWHETKPWEAKLDNAAYWESFCDKIGKPEFNDLFPEDDKNPLQTMLKELKEKNENR